MNELIVLVDGRPVLHPEDSSAKKSEERLISLVVQSPTGDVVRRVIEQVHNVSAFFSWIAEVAWNLEHDAPPNYLPVRESLAAAIESFYESALDSELDQVEEDLFQYRAHHDLRFAFRGTDVPSVLLGSWQGNATLSSTADGGYSYQIDLHKLLVTVGS